MFLMSWITSYNLLNLIYKVKLIGNQLCFCSMLLCFKYSRFLSAKCLNENYVNSCLRIFKKTNPATSYVRPSFVHITQYSSTEWVLFLRQIGWSYNAFVKTCIRKLHQSDFNLTTGKGGIRAPGLSAN